MLYARCGFCGGIVPLWCSGQFMPHMPIPVAASPMGPACMMGGVLPPIFTCGFCGGRQVLFLPGAPMPAPAFPGQTTNVAPVVQAQQNAPPHVLNDMFKQLAGNIGTELGKGAAGALFGQSQR